MRAAPHGYSLGKPLHSSPHAEVHEAVRVADGAQVVLKVYVLERHGDPSLRAQREFDALRRVSSPGVPRALDLDRSGESPVLVLERVPGLPLARELDPGPLSLAAWLDVAIRLTETLSHVHAARILHKDLTPSNVLVERQSGRLWLIDFGVATELGTSERTNRWRGGTIADTFRYISPELTGRMNRGCDFRSDLYSLGATLYHAGCGVPPFDLHDPLELIHCHMARWPEAPIGRRPELPDAISRLILKLLRKEPDERYQSASSLLADLIACREQFERRGRIDPDFVLASGDAPDRPRFSPRLHGREGESALLRRAYERAAAGQVQVVLLAGEAGAGKSSLVDPLRSRIAETGGYLAIGKFDSYRDRAYAGWVAALGSLAQQMLLESDERLARWRAELGAGLGSIARAIVGLAPDLEFVLGEVAPVPQLGSGETQARLSLALQRFVAACATPEHPLVLFLDDLQWSDAGSRVLLEELLSSIDATALLVIGAYRSAEVDAAHPLTALVTRLVQRGVELERIELGPLDISATSGMLAEALGRPPESLRELALLVERKTGNNPLLARQFLEHLHEHGWLRHERGVGWTWDVVQIEAADVPDGAVALLTAKIERLAPAPRAALEFASCVSHEFDADLLAELSDQPRASLEAPLFALVQEGLIAPAPGGLRFAHDRIREAARARLSDEERGRLHARTACLLIERTTESERVQRVFEIVDHLERGLAHLPGELRLTTIELHVMAGKVALACGVGAIAAHYFSVARGLLQERDWDERRSLVFELWTQSAESAFQCRELEAALALLDEVEPRARSGMEFAQVAARRILVLALARPAEDGARYVLAALRRLGIRWSLRPSRLRTRIMLRVLAWRLGSAEHPVLKPATTPDLDAVAAMLVISSAGGVLSRADLQLVALGVGYVLRGFLRSGYVAPPAYAIGAFALYAYLVLGDVPLAERHTRHALYWSERVPHALYGNRAEIALQLTLRPWLERRRDALRHSSRLVEQARETGDREFEYYTRFLDATYRALAGDPVPQAEQRLRELAEDVQSSTHIYTEPEVVYGVYKLLYACPSESEIERGATDLEATLRGGSASAEVYARTLRCMVLCVYGRYDLAFAQSETLGKRLFRVAPFVHVADHTFYRGLAAAELATLARGRARWRLRRALGTSLRRLRFWAKAGPDFVHMVQFLEAESARLRGRLAVARSLYERAAQRARQQEFPHHAALAHERRGRMLAAQRRGTEASAAIREAIALYRLWGARDKADALEAEAAS